MAASARSPGLLDVEGGGANAHRDSSSKSSTGAGAGVGGDLNDLGVSIYDQTVRNNSSPMSQNDELGIALNLSTGSVGGGGPSDTDSKDSRSNSENQFTFKLDQKDFDESELEREHESKLDAVAAGSTGAALANQASCEEDEEQEPIEMNEEWQKKPKHIFILSEAGKPIYSLHGNEVGLITFMGLLQALVSIVECDNENQLKYVKAGDHKFVFLHKSHLIFVCVCGEAHACFEQLETELFYAYNQILSVVTLSLIEKIFARHHNFDLRNKLSGTEKLLTNIITRTNDDYGMWLNCVNTYPLAQDTRDQISRMIAQQITSIKYVLFGLLLFDNRLVAIIRPKSKNVHPADIHLLVNVITGLDTPKTAEFTWYPICLPNFDSSGIMYAYISQLDGQCRTYLILLTGLCDQEQSSELDECRKRIQQKLSAQNMLPNISLNSNNRDSSLRLEQIGVPELRHFLFKDNKMLQYFVSDYALPYSIDKGEQQRIFNVYRRLYHKLHNPTNSLRIVYSQHKYETVLGWLTTDFEIYATFSPLVSKELSIGAINKVLEFIRKNKSKIFITSMPTLQR